jgi:FkbM family methyltransferase
LKRIARKIASRLPEHKIIKKFPDFKIALLTSHTIDFKILCGIGHEPKTVGAIRRLVQPGMRAVDVGANIGWMTLHLASSVGPSGKVAAFEASDWTFGRLDENIALNGFDWVELHRGAVGPSAQQVEIQLPRGYRLDGSATEGRQSVPMVRLDSVLSHWDHVDFIKSDTDGYECGVFEGAQAILERDHPTLLFEVAPFCSDGTEGLKSLFDKLESMNYEFEDLAGNPVDPVSEMKKVLAPEAIELVARHRSKLASLSN